MGYTLIKADHRDHYFVFFYLINLLMTYFMQLKIYRSTPMICRTHDGFFFQSWVLYQIFFTISSEYKSNESVSAGEFQSFILIRMHIDNKLSFSIVLAIYRKK